MKPGSIEALGPLPIIFMEGNLRGIRIFLPRLQDLIDCTLYRTSYRSTIIDFMREPGSTDCTQCQVSILRKNVHDIVVISDALPISVPFWILCPVGNMLCCASKKIQRCSRLYSGETGQIYGLSYCTVCVSAYCTLATAAIIGATKIGHVCLCDVVMGKRQRDTNGGGEKPPLQ
jgi:hypothetical protein